jgi:hypothetical protein
MSGPVPTARAVGDPRRMPELRQQLIDFGRPGGVWEQTEVERAMTEITGFGATATTDEQGRRVIAGPRGWSADELTVQLDMAQRRGTRSMDWYRAVCEEGQLIYVTADLIDVVEQAAAATPDDLTLTLDDLPAPSGLVVLARPIFGTDAGPERPGESIRVDGLMWGTAKLPPADLDWLNPGVVFTEDALSVGSLRWVEADHGDQLAAVMSHGTEMTRTHLPAWMPMGRSDWPYGTPIPYRHRHDIPDPSLSSMVEDRRFMAALFAVLNQRRLVATEVVAPSRQVRRQAERKGRRHPDVVVVHLRRNEYSTEPIGEGRTVGVRFPVRPFYRRQPVGPRAEGRRKIVLVPGHWRGPEGAPVVHAERVWSLDR